jgi:hypothetical protein
VVVGTWFVALGVFADFFARLFPVRASQVLPRRENRPGTLAWSLRLLGEQSRNGRRSSTEPTGAAAR